MPLHAVNGVVRGGQRETEGKQEKPAEDLLPPDSPVHMRGKVRLLLFDDVAFHGAKNAEQFLLLRLPDFMLIQRRHKVFD